MTDIQETPSNLTLYHYVHCPFCVRVRLALGFLKYSYISVVLPYDDEVTPKKLTGIKMLPIMTMTKNGQTKTMNESLDIIEQLDIKNSLHFDHYALRKDTLETMLEKLGKNIHNLAMPYWIWTPEFDSQSRDYFQKKKELKRGPFKTLVHRREEFIEKLQTDLKILEKEINPFFQSSEMTVSDLMIAAHLWGLYIVPEFQFSPKIHQYLQTIKKNCDFQYHQDFWL